MALTLLNFDNDIRRLMLNEIDADIAACTLFISPRLSARGIQDYPQLLKDAVARGNDDWLEAQINQFGRLNLTEEKKKPKSPS